MSVRWPRLLTPTQLSQILRSQKNPLTALQIFKDAKDKYPSYHHNGPVYATMLGILGNSNRIAEMKEVINQMREDSCECKDSVFVTAIKTYANAGQISEAVSLFKNIPKFNCVNWTESFNTLLQILVKESKLETAHRIFLENSCGWEDSYRILMRGLCEDGRLNEATHLLYSMFWRISQKGSGEDIVVYRTLLDALCDNGQVEEALEILGKILRKGLKAPKRNRHRLDLSQCDNSLIRGGVPSLASYTAMAVDLYYEGKTGQADKVLDETQERGYRPSLRTYEAKITALCREGRGGEAIDVIEREMVEKNSVPNVRLYNVLMKGLCDAGNSAIAVGYLKRMAKQVGCVANQETYGILVDGLCRDGRFVEASKVLEEMLIKSYWPPADTYNILIRGLSSMGRQYEAVMWLEEMVSQDKLPELHLWSSLVTSVCSNMVAVDASCETFNQLSSCS
ncbi:pentatricopeptide repeat-containing family protein [Salix suchowensis]|nr:pentatricopeptide repeat-containing family protein [Salix suchowensis]